MSAEVPQKFRIGDGDRVILSTQSSVDSVASVIFPWRRGFQQRGPIVPHNETGRDVEATGFFLCMASILLLSSGTGLFGAALWGIIYRIPYMAVTDSTVYIGTNSFGLVAAVASFPCCWIAWQCHNNPKNYAFLPLLLILLGFSLVMLVTGATMGLTYRSRMTFERNGTILKLFPSPYHTGLNQTMFGTMAVHYELYKKYTAWDTVQQRLKCCGVNSFKDWLTVRGEIPKSCCADFKCKNQITYKSGCLDRVASDLAWEVSLLTGLSCITFLIQMCTLCLVTSTYIRDRLRLTNNESVSQFMQT